MVLLCWCYSGTAELMGEMLEWSHASKTSWIRLKVNLEGVSEEVDIPWSLGYGHYREHSGDKWGWITRQQPVSTYYPRSLPQPHLTPPPHRCVRSHHQSHYNDTIVGSYRVNGERDRGRGDSGVLFMWRASQSCIFYACRVSLHHCGCLSLTRLSFNSGQIKL